jgi:hypothetical protein
VAGRSRAGEPAPRLVVWLKRVLLPARMPGAEMPEVTDLQEMHAMLYRSSEKDSVLQVIVPMN